MYIINLIVYDDSPLAPSAENLQGLINVVAKWCMKWGMSVNLGKTNTIYSIFPKKVKIKAYIFNNLYL